MFFFLIFKSLTWITLKLQPAISKIININWHCVLYELLLFHKENILLMDYLFFI